MNLFQRLALVLTVCLGGMGAAAAEPLPLNLIVLMPGDKAQLETFTTRLQQIPALANARESAAGSNLTLIVSVAQVPTSGGTAASTTTGLLAASTLGLIPTVENKDISVHYELRANYMTLATFDYSENFTSVSNIFGEFGKLPEDARQWVLGTTDLLARDLAASVPVKALQAEYDSYFPTAPAATP